MEPLVLSPAEFVSLVNQTLDYAYPQVVVEGELTNFRVSKNRWVYFDLQDEEASVKCFGTVYMLPGPLEDGLKIQVAAAPRLHPRFGFSLNISSISPVGAGSIKKAADLLAAKLEAEGLFDAKRKRALPEIPVSMGLITAGTSAAYADFIKVINERWGGVAISLADVYVQGAQAPLQIVAAIEYFNKLPQLPDILVITRGGGSAEDLAAFSDERLVRAVAASRIPTVVAIGHEVDISLAELAADLRASTPSNAAQLIVPHRREVISALGFIKKSFSEIFSQQFEDQSVKNQQSREYLTSQVNQLLRNSLNYVDSTTKLLAVLDPRAALKRGYALVSRAGQHVSSSKNLSLGDKLKIQLADGTIGAKVEDL